MKSVLVASAAMVLCSCAPLHKSDNTDAGHALVRSEQRWSAGGAGGRVLRTPRVRLFTTLEDGPLLERLPVTLEHTITGFGRFWPDAPELDHSLDVIVYASVEQWRRAVRDRFAIEPGRALDSGAATSGGVSLLHDIGDELTLRLAAHELWHAYKQTTIGRGFPTAIDEAIACYVEGMRWDGASMAPVLSPWSNPVRQRRLRALVRDGRLGSLAEHLAGNPHELVDSAEQLDDYYARAWALGLTLLASDDVQLREGVARMLGDARRGVHLRGMLQSEPDSWDDLCGRYFQQRLEELDIKWRIVAHRLADGRPVAGQGLP